jgi:hypothetical protein
MIWLQPASRANHVIWVLLIHPTSRKNSRIAALFLSQTDTADFSGANMDYRFRLCEPDSVEVQGGDPTP